MLRKQCSDCTDTMLNTVDSTYKKQISWLEGGMEIAVHEYKGKSPAQSQHGKTTTGNPGRYVRMKPKVMEKVKDT